MKHKEPKSILDFEIHIPSMDFRIELPKLDLEIDLDKAAKRFRKALR